MARYTVLYDENFSDLERKLRTITKKCEKEGYPYSYKVGESYQLEFKTRKGIQFYLTVVDVEIECEFKRNGWNALGCVTRKDGIVQCYFNDENQELWKEYKDTDFRCDHCKRSVYRNSVVVIENEKGERKVVGTNCVKEYTNGLDGALIFQHASFVMEFRKRCLSGEICLENCISESADGDDLLFWGVPVPFMYNVRKALAVAFKAVRTLGYTKTDEPNSTKSVVQAEYFEGWYDEEDLTKADAAIAWIKGLPLDRCDEYLFNLQKIATVELCGRGHIGFLASMPVAYAKAVEVKVLKDKPKSEYIGEVGEKVELQAVLTKSISYQSAFGTGYFHMFADEKGNVLKWSTNKWLKIHEGAKVTLKGTIKEHSEHRGVKQTVLTRCKVESCE